jgi:hypothetical protein
MSEVNVAYINDTLQGILDGVYDCLAADSVLGAPEHKFLSFTRPPDDCCDYLAIWFESLQPTREFPLVGVGDAAIDCTDSRLTTVSLKLVRPCWPVVKDNPKKPFPPPAEIQAAAENLTIDANVVWCCLATGLGSDALRADSLTLGFRMIELRPDDPRGGCAGFTVRFAIELDPCCA